MNFTNPCQNERGAALVISLMFLAILAMLGTTAVVLTTTDMQIGANYKASAQAFYDADAGVNYGIAKMEAGLKDGSFPLPTTVGGTSTLTYTVPSGFSFFISPITMLAANAFSLTSTGTDPANANARTILAITFQRGSAITFAAFGDKKLETKNSAAVYSYDSRSSALPASLADSTGQGDIGSNDHLITHNNSEIDGDGVFGEKEDGSPTDNSIHDVNDFSGDAPADAGRVDPDPLGIDTGGEYDPTIYATTNDNADAVPAIVGNTIDLTSSTPMTLYGNSGGANYYATKFVLKKDAILTIDTNAGPVRLFLDGASAPFEVKNSSQILVTPPGNEDQFAFFSNNEGTLDLKHGSAFTGLFYAPKADIVVKNSVTVIGALWGKTVDLKNSGTLYFNTALSDIYLSKDLTKVSWRDARS